MAARSRRLLPLLLVVILIPAVLAAQPAPAVGTCPAPPDVVATVDLTPGTLGTAWTVVEGTTPVSFDVKVLGTLNDALAPGKDLVLIQVSGPVIDATGGIAAGMSGSPVYVSGKLAGSVSYSLGTGSDPTIGGMTPAEDIVGVIDYPDPAAPLKVKLSDTERGLVAREAGISLSRVPGSIEPIAVPVAVSGLSKHGIELLQRQLEGRGGANLRLFAAGSAATPTQQAPVPFVPGESMAAVTSYGDITFGGIGTVTAVCGNQVMGWGHPLWREGKTTLGMAAADIITVVTDPSDVFGPFKVGNITEGHGVIDQDRLSGIRGVEGAAPATVPITSHIENPELGTSRDGETDVVSHRYLADIAAFHVYGNLDVVADWSGEGSSTLDWEIQGTDENGQPFTLDYGDVYYSSWDFAYDNVMEFYGQMARLNSFPGAHITSAHVIGSVSPTELRSEIYDMWIATPRQPTLKPRGVVRARPGDKLKLRVFLHPVAGGPDTSVDLTYKIPRWAGGSGPLVASGGADTGGSYYYYYYGSSDDGASTVQEYLDEKAAETLSSDIVVSLFPQRHTSLDEAKYRQDTRISGEQGVRLVLAR